MAIEYRVCKTNAEFEQASKMEMIVWGMAPFLVISPHTLHVLTHAGGNVMGAFEGERMIGCTIAFAMRESDRLWSHVAAVLPDYRGQNIGYTLKQKQREWALEQSLKRMSWTFDPAMRRNAHFNFHLLGVQSNTYHANFYGDMDDDLNRGIASDRMETLWHLADNSKHEIPDEAKFLLKAGQNQQSQILQKLDNDLWYFVEIPYDFPAIKENDKNLAASWRDAMREILLSAFENDYWAVDFVTKCDEKRCWYVLKKA
jgi:predicted GNAT superfamily acetyltransferase